MLKKLEHFHPALITERYFPQEVARPNEINEGRCWQWAYLARKTFSNVQLWCVDIHAFIKHGGKFYDSETLQGTHNHLELPATYRGRYPGYVPPHQHTEKDFRYQWVSQTFRFHTSWEELDRLAQKELKRHVRAT